MSDPTNTTSSIPDEAKQAVSVLLEQLSPRLTTLSIKERRQVFKYGEASMGFVENAVQYATENSEMIPAYIDMDGMKSHLAFIDELQQIRRQLTPLLESLDDTLVEAGGKTMKQALLIYRAVKTAEKANISGAKSIASEMRQRFKKASKEENQDASPEEAVSET